MALAPFLYLALTICILMTIIFLQKLALRPKNQPLVHRRTYQKK